MLINLESICGKKFAEILEESNFPNGDKLINFYSLKSFFFIDSLEVISMIMK